uniref:Uncharacterized protein n=1 Tax=Ditylenchus dipsaci TaxID=166011 RepID=A0A915DSR7_9BILA
MDLIQGFITRVGNIFLPKINAISAFAVIFIGLLVFFMHVYNTLSHQCSLNSFRSPHNAFKKPTFVSEKSDYKTD